MTFRTAAVLFCVSAVAGVAACGGNTPAKVSVAPEGMPAAFNAMAALREQTADQQVTQVLGRLTFGARPGDVEKVRAMGVDQWIDRQLHPERIDDGKADAFVAGLETYHSTPAELVEKYPRPNQLLTQLGARGNRDKLSAADSARLRAAQAGFRKVATETQIERVGRAVLTERQLQEVMTDFWLNHFNIYLQKGGPEPYLIAEFESKVIRPNSLGKFRTLLGAVAKSPAMLFYLDNWESQADSTRPRLEGPRVRVLGVRPRPGVQIPMGMTPEAARQLANRRRAGLNENYGRELLELHTLGVDGGYTQQDVINVAEALTGWTMRQPQRGGEFFFNPMMHDAGEKVVLGHKLKAGRGMEDGEDVLDIVSRHPATAHYIAFKLARRFVSDTPSTELVDRAAETFTRTDGDIREVVRAIVTSPEFFAASAYRSKVKSPFEVVTSALRALDAQPDRTPRTALIVGTLGEPIYGHQAPNGWPETGDQWMNTGAILNRINFGIQIAASRIPGASPIAFQGAEALRSAPLDKQVDGVVAALLGGHVSPETRAILISGENPFLASASANDTSAVTRKNTPDPDPDVAMALPGERPLGPPLGRNIAMARLPEVKGLAQVVGLAIGSPEFQRR